MSTAIVQAIYDRCVADTGPGGLISRLGGSPAWPRVFSSWPVPESDPLGDLPWMVIGPAVAVIPLDDKLAEGREEYRDVFAYYSRRLSDKQIDNIAERFRLIFHHVPIPPPTPPLENVLMEVVALHEIDDLEAYGRAITLRSIWRTA